MKKTLFATILLLLLPLAARAQHFEWAKGYGQGLEGQEIIGSVTDSLGNLYILGYFHTDIDHQCRWDGNNGPRLLPIATDRGLDMDIVIAKISPSGEMQWRKAINTMEALEMNSYPYDIKKVGDTAFACLVEFMFPREGSYCYYLDTLFTTRTNDLIPGQADYPLFYMDRYTALITFNFEGEVLEQHFIQISYTDSTGNDYVKPTTRWGDLITGRPLLFPTFDIDSRGNIYLSRLTNDTFGDETPEQGNITSLKFWVDHRLAGTVTLDRRLRNSLPHIFKFSPHFDTLLANRYLVQNDVGRVEAYSGIKYYMKLDRDDNLYAVGALSQDYGEHMQNITIVIDSSRDDLFMPLYEYNAIKGYLVKFDTSLRALYCVYLEDSLINQSSASSDNGFKEIDFDYDHNLLFISEENSRAFFGHNTDSLRSILLYRGHPLTGLKNDAFFLAVDIDNGDFFSFGGASSRTCSGLERTPFVHGNLRCWNNRVLFQCEYSGGLRLPDRNTQLPNWFNHSLGLQIFDYEGTLIGGEVYNVIDPHSTVGPVSLADSALYLSTRLFSDATFGDIHVPVTETGEFACIAKYVDTSFMSPYVAPDPDAGTASPDDETAFSLYPNPATRQLQIDSRGEAVTSVTAVNLHGQSVPLAVKGNHVDVGSLAPGLYILEITTTNHKSHLKFIKP